MTPEDMKLMEATAELAACKAVEKSEQQTEKLIKAHIDSCPVGKAMGNSKAFLIGVLFAVGSIAGLVGGGLGWAVAKGIELLK